MRVMKFGGSSVAKPERIRMVKDILNKYYIDKISFTVVFSAFGGVTDELLHVAALAEKADPTYKDTLLALRERHISAVKDLITNVSYLKDTEDQVNQNFEDLDNLLEGIFLLRECTPRTKDYLLSFGERNSAFIISQFLKQEGLPATFLDARNIITTDKNFGAATVDKEKTYSNIREFYSQNADIQIVTGFIAAAKGGLTSTLGRGGSDYTAALLGAALDAEIVEIWTDVNGILTCDPRVVNQTFSIPEVSYEEAFEMSHFGAKVIYPPTIIPAKEKNIPLVIKNTFEPNHPGTLITAEGGKSGLPVKAVSSIKDISLLTLQGSGMVGVPGIASRLFQALSLKKINVILITQGSSEHTISFAISPADVKRAEKSINEEFVFEISKNEIDPIIVENDLSIVAIIGEDMRSAKGIAANMFYSLGSNGINVIAIAQGSSERNISAVIRQAHLPKALNSLHDSFFLSKTHVINVYIVGIGTVGGTLLEQMIEQKQYLDEEKNITIRVVGLANSKKMIFDHNGIDLERYKELLSEGENCNLDDFTDRILQEDFSTTVFVDNTASDVVPSYYEKLLSHSISVCTPNKVAASSNYEEYKNLMNLAQLNNAHFGIETNVGAGLPVISTFRDLVDSGDEIEKIEAVLSGSLSYIFNNFLEDRPFVDIVKEAQSLGYTEPDPRVDLRGVDVKRKLIILMRESGKRVEQEDVKVAAFLPEDCDTAPDIASFYECLAKNQAYFDKIKEKCISTHTKPVFLAKYDGNEASVGMEYVAASSPFSVLKESDNMICISSKRYKKSPLVIQGPGAGPQVTAAGVFAEIISLANRNTERSL